MSFLKSEQKGWKLSSAVFLSLSVISIVLTGCSRQDEYAHDQLAKQPGLDVNTVLFDPISEATKADEQEVKQNLQEAIIGRPGAHGAGHPHASLTADQLIKVALQHAAEGRNELALGTLGEAIGKFPDQPAIYGVRGSFLLQQGKTAEALADFNQSIKLYPHDPSVFTNRAQALRSFGRNKEAMQDLNKAIELDNQFVAALFNRGALAFSEGKYDQALVDFNACIHAKPNVAAAYFNRASVHEAMGNRTMAVADLEHFIEVSPNDSWKQAASEQLEQWKVPTT